MRIVSRNNGTDYFDLIGSIDGHLIMLSMQGSVDLDSERYFALRHDVDGPFDHALKFARAEHENGLRSTYFLHPNRGYFYMDGFLEKCRDLESMGHEVGLHCDALEKWIETGEAGPIERFVFPHLDHLRFAGIRVVGTSAHGSQACKDRGVKAYDIWEESPNKDVGEIPRISLSDYGLDYEAYFLRRDAYVTDSGCRMNDAANRIKEFNKLPAGMLQFLSHPMHWDITK